MEWLNFCPCSLGTFISRTRQLPCIFLLDGEKAEINWLVAKARTIFGHVQFRVRWQTSIYWSSCRVPFIICTWMPHLEDICLLVICRLKPLLGWLLLARSNYKAQPQFQPFEVNILSPGTKYIEEKASIYTLNWLLGVTWDKLQQGYVFGGFFYAGFNCRSGEITRKHPILKLL